MAIDDTSGQEVQQTPPAESSRSTVMFMIVFLALAALAVTDIYTLSKFNSMSESVTASQAKAQSDMDSELNSKVTALENSSAQALDSLKSQLDQTAKRTGWTGKELKSARAVVSKLQQDTADQANELKQEIATKADQQQVGQLSQDVSATKSDLDNTKKAVDDTRSDLGMARSEFGTLIARNHDDIETLRKMGERDYFEFTLPRNKQETVAGVGLVLKRTNVKHHRASVNLVANDMVIEKKDRTVDEPIFFSVGNSKTFYEMVINQVQSNQVKGYISTPKGANETNSARAEGGR